MTSLATPSTVTTPSRAKHKRSKASGRSLRIDRRPCRLTREIRWKYTPDGYRVIDVKMLQPSTEPRSRRPRVRWLLFCAFFLGLFSMHVFGAAWTPAAAHETHGEIHGSVDRATAAAYGPPLVEPQRMLQASGHVQGVGVGECAVVGVCALGLMLLAFKIAQPAMGTKASRAWPLSRHRRLFSLLEHIPPAPPPQRLGICRR